MTRLLDTDACICIIKRRPASVVARFESSVDIRNTGISSITVAALRFGAEKSSFGERSLGVLNLFLASLTIHPFTEVATLAYARLRVHLERSGTPIGPLDTLIAAHAFSLGATLVTNNVRELERVPDLNVGNWIDE